MCGIFGLVSSNKNKNFKKLITKLFKLSSQGVRSFRLVLDQKGK